ncbi:MAG: sucrase ferredoxin [Polyangiales bacterium]
MSSAAPNETSPFCSSVSAGLAEPMAGTAPKDGGRFLVLSYAGLWAPDALPGSSLPEPVKARLASAAAAVPRTRVQLVKHAGEATRPTLFVARTEAGSERLVRFELDRHEALVDLDLESVLEGRSDGGGAVVDEPLVLVCTHGKRDRCCALHGTKLYETLHGLAGESVWQSSHLAGHRFAPIVVTLPDAYCFGRMTAEEGPRFLEALRQGRFHDLSRLRGRAGLDEPLQAAEVLFRQREGLDRIADVRVLGGEPTPEGMRARLATPAGERIVLVRKRALEGRRPVSCGDEPSPAFAFEL